MTSMCTRFGALLTAVMITAGALAVPAVAIAAEADSYTLDEPSLGYGQNDEAESDSFSLEGGMTWDQDTGLASDSFQIADSNQSSSASNASGTSGTTGGGGGTAGGDGAGGHRGHGTNALPGSVSPGPGPMPAPSTAPGSGPHRLRPAPVPEVAPIGATAAQPRFEVPALSAAVAERIAAPQSPADRRFFDAVDPARSDPQAAHAAAPAPRDIPIWVILLAAAGGALLATGLQRPPVTHSPVPAKRGKRARRKLVPDATRRAMFILLGVACILTSASPRIAAYFVPSADAAVTTPAKYIYNGRLLKPDGTAITTAHRIRFSFWIGSNAVPSDLTATGAINVGSPSFGGWQEVHLFTPDTNGYFSVAMGTGTVLKSLQDFTPAELQKLFMQVEVKPGSAADTSFEILDPRPSDPLWDRSPVVSVPFATNAEYLDLRDTGTGSGSIPVLQTGGLLPTGTIPGATNADTFVLDGNGNATSNVTLQFGSALAETLKFDLGNARFTFSDDLRVEGDLTVTGLINGVDITNSQSSTGALKAFSGGGLNLKVAGGNYRLNGNVTNFTGNTMALTPNTTNYVFFGSGGLVAKTAGFPADESYIPVAQVVTTTGSISTVGDRRVLSSDDREQTVVEDFHAEFDKATYQGDGSDNVGQMIMSHDNIALKNFYEWTSTKGTLQDYDILIRTALPDDFVRWKAVGGENPLKVTYRSTSASSGNNRLDIQVYDTNGVPVTLSGSTAALASTSWESTQVEFTSASTWTPGADFLIRLRLSALGDFQMHVGDMTLRSVVLRSE